MGVKPSVLIIVENLPVPFDKRVWKEASALTENGYQVTVLCPRGKGYEQGHEVIDGIHIYRHPMPEEGNSTLGYLREYGWVLFWEFVYTFWIYLRRGFRIIQGCNPPDFIFLIALPFKILGVKYIFDHHDASPELYLSKYEKEGLLYKIQVLLESLTYRTSDVVMCTNGSYKDLAVSRGDRNPEDVFIVRNGPDPRTFKPVPPNPALKHGKSYLVGYVGTMSAQEGLDILLDIALHIKNQERRDIHFTCVGGGPSLVGLRKIVEDKDLKDIVDFTGRISDERLLEILSTADVCVNPDKPCVMNDISTMIKITEYMALGKPIVQFDLKEGRFSAGEASLYADVRNTVEDFAAKILWLLDHPDERKKMGEFGRKRVQDELAWNYSVNNLLATYAKALKNGHNVVNLSACEPNESAQHQSASSTSDEETLTPRPVNTVGQLSHPSGDKALIEYLRCPAEYVDFGLAGELRSDAGFFPFGPGIVCYGRSTTAAEQDRDRNEFGDERIPARVEASRPLLAFDPDEVATNLRCERYVTPAPSRGWRRRLTTLKHDSYYLARPFLGVKIRKHIQKLSLRGWNKLEFPQWPVDTTVEQLFEKLLSLTLESRGINEIPFIWFWPNGASSCVTMTHDVETESGANWCSELMDIDDAFGIRSAFQIVPEERYPVSQALLDSIRQRGFEINIQDLNHDGQLFKNRDIFLARAKVINKYAAEYGARGFRSAALYRNPEWYDALDMSYDMSIPNVAHLEPQRGGCCTVFPYFIGKVLEIPLTTTQDYSLFHILNEYSIELWKRQIEIIEKRHGLVSFIVHPDYIIPERPRNTYLALLEYLGCLRRDGRHWFALPGEVDAWWRARANMRIAFKDRHWAIEGPGSERARIAFAKLEGTRLIYTVSTGLNQPLCSC